MAAPENEADLPANTDYGGVKSLRRRVRWPDLRLPVSYRQSGEVGRGILKTFVAG